MAEETPEVYSEEVMTEETPVESPESEEIESEETEASEDDIYEIESDEPSEIVKSERGQKRIQELANKANKAEELEEEVKNLRERLVDEPEDRRTSEDILAQLKADGIPYTGDYVQDLRMAEERAAEKALKTFREEQRTRDLFNSDISYITKKYPELNEAAGEAFDDDLTDSVVKLYKKSSNLNPDLRLKDFVDDIMKVRKQGESKGKTVTSRELAQQENEGAVKPTTGVKRIPKDPKEMTLEELKAIVPR